MLTIKLECSCGNVETLSSETKKPFATSKEVNIIDDFQQFDAMGLYDRAIEFTCKKCGEVTIL